MYILTLYLYNFNKEPENFSVQALYIFGFILEYHK